MCCLHGSTFSSTFSKMTRYEWILRDVVQILMFCICDGRQRWIDDVNAVLYGLATISQDGGDRWALGTMAICPIPPASIFCHKLTNKSRKVGWYHKVGVLRCCIECAPNFVMIPLHREHYTDPAQEWCWSGHCEKFSLVLVELQGGRPLNQITALVSTSQSMPMGHQRILNFPRNHLMIAPRPPICMVSR